MKHRHSLTLLSLLAILLAWPCAAGESAGDAAGGRTAVSSKPHVLSKEAQAKIKALTEGKDLSKMSAEDRKALQEKIQAIIQADREGKSAPEKPKEEEAGQDDIMDEYADMLSSFADVEVQQKEIFYYHCKHIQSSSLKRVLVNFITTSGTVAASDESDIVVVADVKQNIPKLREIAERIDQRVPQILVEAQIVELTLDSDFEKEVKHEFVHTGGNLGFVRDMMAFLSTPGAQPTAEQGFSGHFRPYVKNYNGKRNELLSFLRYLETKGKAKILSAPNLILRRDSEGSIVTGEDVPILEQTVVGGSISTSTVFKRVGIKLRVKPSMIRGDTVRMTVNPEVSTVTGYTSAGENGVSNPIIAVRDASTELEVKDGELISIGGLLRSEQRSVRKRIPIASSIPVLGHLFRATRIEEVKTQLVIFLSIRILDEGQPNGVMVHRPRDIPEHVRREIDVMEEAEKEKRPHAQILHDLKLFMRDGRED